MKKLLQPAVLLSLVLSVAAHAAPAETDAKPAKPNPRSTVPRYATPYVKRQAQLEAMTPRADNVKNAYAADTALSPGANGSYLPPPIHMDSSVTGVKRKLPRLQSTSSKTAAKASDALYGNDQWSSEPTYVDPITANPYGVR